ncbi:hypothetical protein AWC31_14105 [Mycolicibacterium wolinskyi]|uniref:Uncharacterized protein n=1 Tax=Mycolicibacterium wolinskyi TaxID=59750 RepID=A0A1X2FJ24_9MYCO|nr:hypothetical protein AWC31_14105 [Mycolicibacterium wolinskyi]
MTESAGPLGECKFAVEDRVKIDTGGFGKVTKTIRGADGWTCIISVPGQRQRTEIFVHESRLTLWTP